MKRQLLAIGLAGLSTTAFAQSSVTLYGVIDEGVQYLNNVKQVVNGKTVGGSQIGLDSVSGPWGSRWGVKGAEDLGGGWKAIFTLESGMNLNNGALAQGGTMFGRQAFVGITQDRLGTITLGRQYDSVSDMSAAFGPQTAWGTSAGHPGDIDNMIRSYRFNNTIKYTSPNLAGFTLNATGTLGGVAGDFSQSSAYTFGVLYSRNALVAGAAYEFVKNPSNVGAPLNSNANAAPPATTGAYSPLNSGYLAGAHPAGSWQDIVAGAAYTFDRFAIGANYSNVRYGNIGNLNGASAVFNTIEVNGKVQFNPAWFLGLVYSYTKGNSVVGDLGNQHFNQFGFLVNDTLSKRTDIYFEGIYQIASGTNSLGGQARANIDSLGESSSNHQLFVRLALRHKF
ncbi:porin [Paraburkholderia sp. Ac-20336]|uniref:porin n=1 Tax=Burkholderiaceae TaxID=119060 RepID=UPI0014233368|nr:MULTISPECIES: porin [Burkholderiaceae]MBN3805489.1 porin [Paraburkholderia sp. Ac-20336]MBN3849491.1 porin [Paraburkholderia sp. Ac-20342]NIF52820.1 porin [Burkholderia sp. Ax-1724]NIF78759.1 porin [Paraburkholderia sp. Cy-641]